MLDFEKWNKKSKKLDHIDFELNKLSTAASILFLITIWSQLNNLLMSIHWIWYLIIAILASYRPMKKLF